MAQIQPAVHTSAHLLRNHDDTRSLGRSPESGNSKQLNEPREHTRVSGDAGLLDKKLLLLDLSMDVVKFLGRSNLGASETEKAFVRARESSLGHEPSETYLSASSSGDGFSGPLTWEIQDKSRCQ